MSLPRPRLVWFRRDLRATDHPGLAAAAASGAVVAVFVLDPALLARRHHDASRRLRFLRAGLEALDADLRALGLGLVVRRGAPVEVVPALAREIGARYVHVTREFSRYGSRRDGQVARALARVGAELLEHGGNLRVEPEEIPGPAGRGYAVFAPFHRAWNAVGWGPRASAPERLGGPAIAGLPSREWGLPAGAPPVAAGAAAARRTLETFLGSGAADAYASRRDILAVDGTSSLSAHLRFGMCTPAQIGRAIGADRGELGRDRAAFWRQLAWRDFHHHLVARNPDVLRQAQRPEFRAMRWDDTPGHFDAWAEGRTGVPLVDAGMRQLASTGWLPNRARMVVASFLVKDLLVDWRRGETHFMRHLLDGDPASNNGGWQWVAGTGTDSAPYFRVFNPVLQGKRFDPEGDYVRRWVPELRAVPGECIHEPWRMTGGEQSASGCVIGADYPRPIVDHAERRRVAIERYRGTRAAGSAEA